VPSCSSPVLPLAALKLLPDIGGKNLFVLGGYVLLGVLLAEDPRTLDVVAARRHWFGAGPCWGLRRS
jgi:hypothetical protein